MRGATKMFMVSNSRGGDRDGGNRDTRYEMEDAYSEMRGGYQNESRRGSRGALTWDTREPEGYGRSGMRGGMGSEDNMESRRRYRRHSDGTFAPRSEGWRDYPPPVYRQEGGETMNRVIGFGQQEMGNDYRSDAAYNHMDEMGYRRSDMMMGGASGQTHHLNEEMAEEWMQGLNNSDGTKGPHWSKEQVKQIMSQRKMDMDPLEAWVALNAVYSDYCKVAKAHNVNNMEFYVAMAKAFAEDEDAKPNKLALYYEYIVK